MTTEGAKDATEGLKLYRSMLAPVGKAHVEGRPGTACFFCGRPCSLCSRRHKEKLYGETTRIYRSCCVMCGREKEEFLRNCGRGERVGKWLERKGKKNKVERRGIPGSTTQEPRLIRATAPPRARIHFLPSMDLEPTVDRTLARNLRNAHEDTLARLCSQLRVPRSELSLPCLKGVSQFGTFARAICIERQRVICLGELGCGYLPSDVHVEAFLADFNQLVKDNGVDHAILAKEGMDDRMRNVESGKETDEMQRCLKGALQVEVKTFELVHGDVLEVPPGYLLFLHKKRRASCLCLSLYYPSEQALVVEASQCFRKMRQREVALFRVDFECRDTPHPKYTKGLLVAASRAGLRYQCLGADHDNNDRIMSVLQ